jgi:hypothetical protein
VLLRTAQTSAVEPPFTPEKIHHSQFYSTAVKHAVDQKGGEPIHVFERKVHRMICGPKIANGVYRRRYNDELDKEFDSLNTLNITKTSRLLVT